MNIVSPSSSTVQPPPPRPIPQRIRDELGAIADRYEAACGAALAATTVPDREQAALARRDAVADYWDVSRDLGELLTLMIRHAMQWDAEALAFWLSEALRRELAPLAHAVAALEARMARLEAHDR
jgi:hypothetical protein